MIGRAELDRLAELTATLEALVLLAPVVTTLEQRERWARAVRAAALAISVTADGEALAAGVASTAPGSVRAAGA